MAGDAFIVAGLPKLQNIYVNQGFFISLGLPPDLLIPIPLLEVIGGTLLIVGVLSRITASIFVIEIMVQLSLFGYPRALLEGRYSNNLR